MPDLTPVFGQTSGFTQEPALTIGNMVMQKFLATRLDWKFNRAAAAPFLTVALQQDYITSITNLGWLTQSWRIDINNTANPKPVFAMEEVRDLAQTSYQRNPFQISWIPNNLAIFGTWQANTLYPTGLGAPQTPTSPIQQFIDVNGNFLYVTGFGTSGNSKPSAPASSAAGTTVTDGGVTWTVADPNGIAFRLVPMPACSGIVWQINPLYQKKPPKLTALQNLISPIPDEYYYLFFQGFVTYCYKQAGPQYAKRFEQEYTQWLADLDTTLRAGDRESEDATMYPSESITGGGPFQPLPVGPGYPYEPYAY